MNDDRMHAIAISSICCQFFQILYLAPRITLKGLGAGIWFRGTDSFYSRRPRWVRTLASDQKRLRDHDHELHEVSAETLGTYVVCDFVTQESLEYLCLPKSIACYRLAVIYLSYAL